MTDGVPATPPGLDRLAAAQQDLLRALERTQQEGAQAASAGQALAGISGRASSPDNAITVVVDGGGLPRDITFTDKIAKRSPQQLAAELMGCLHRAQATLAQEFQRQAGNNPFAARITERYQTRFPQPAPEPVAPQQANEIKIGQLPEQESARPPEPAPRPAPRQAPRPRYDEDEEDFGQTSFLQGPDGKRGPDHA